MYFFSIESNNKSNSVLLIFLYNYLRQTRLQQGIKTRLLFIILKIDNAIITMQFWAFIVTVILCYIYVIVFLVMFRCAK